MSITTDFDYDAYEERRIESAKAEGLLFVPETGPKVFCVACVNAGDWNEIHNYIINENEIDGIPNRKIDCINPKKTCDRIGSYEMSDAEAEQLKNHPKVIGVNIDEGYYEGTYKGRDTFLMSDPSSKTPRYGGDVKISRDNSASGYYTGVDSTWLSKTAAQIYRHQTLDNPWKTQSDNNIITDNPEQYGDGTDVDLIVCDSAAWLGHIEFIKTGVGEPTNFVGTNVLKSGFAPSATTGVCGVLDVILSAPYYIDPDFFEADAGNRLRVRWDGTTLPVESAAVDWWGNESTTYRSAKYVSSNISGGTAVIGSNEDFGEINVSSNYTEARHNGDLDTLHTGNYDGTTATHGTPCMSQAFGKTHGWAYNSNKWYISIIWSFGAISTDKLYEVIKVFHDLKPNRTSDNTKNPTISSNSWGSTRSFYNGSYAYFRTPGNGTGEETISVSGSNVSSPNWLRYFYSGNKHARWYPPSDSTMIEGAAMLDSGVIWLSSSGNNNNKQVKGDHPDYNNYVSSSSARTLSSAESNEEMVNRPGNPACIGCVQNYNGTGIDVYRTFNVGALDDDTDNNFDGTYQEQKATYSNMGNAVDFYTIGDGSIGAQGGESSSGYQRNDNSYRLDSNYNIVESGGTQSLTSYDKFFNGTSSACPVGAGLFATKMQYNRDWTWANLKNWLETEVTDQSSDDLFYQGTEATTSSSSNWNSEINLQGGPRKILWDALTGNAPSDESSLMTVTIRLEEQLASRQDLVLELDGRNHSSNTTSWYNSAKNSHHVTLTSGVTYNGYGYVFSNGNYGSFAKTSDFQTIGDFTFETWFYMTATPNGAYPSALFSSWSTFNNSSNKFIFYVNNSNTLVYELDNSETYGGMTAGHSNTVSLNTWHHAVVTRSGNMISFYLDNVKDETTKIYSPNINATLSDVLIGKYSASGSYSFNGTIGAIRFYRRAFTDAEVETNYTEQLPTFGLAAKPKLSLEGITFTF